MFTLAPATRWAYFVFQEFNRLADALQPEDPLGTADSAARPGRHITTVRQNHRSPGSLTGGCPGAVVLPRAAARQSVPRPGSERSPRQHGHVQRSMTTAAARPSSAGWGRPPGQRPLRRALRTPLFRRGSSTRLPTSSAPENVTYHPTMPGMNKPPSRYEVIVRVAQSDGHQPGPATFAVAVGTAASSRNASVSAHTAEEIICIVCVAAADRPAAMAVGLAVVAEALRAGDRVPSPSR